MDTSVFSLFRGVGVDNFIDLLVGIIMFLVASILNDFLFNRQERITITHT
jgi:hypothetical protein